MIDSIGVDVGGARKGFHLVFLQAGRVCEVKQTASIKEAAEWIVHRSPSAVAIDAPCGWARQDYLGSTGKSREAERSLRIDGHKINCFATPSELIASGNGFYGWVRQGMALFEAISDRYPLFAGQAMGHAQAIETFPQAVSCFLAGRHVPAKNKSVVRRQVLRDAGIESGLLSNVDWVDACLCAVAAQAFSAGKFKALGRSGEGWIVVPTLGYVAR